MVRARQISAREGKTDINETSSWQDSTGVVQPPARYLEIVHQLWSLAEEANIHAESAGDASDVHGWLWCKTLANNVMGAVAAATDGLLSTAELEELAEKARADATGRMVPSVE